MYLLFHNYLPLEKGWIPFTTWFFQSSLVEIDQVALEKKIFKNFVNVFSLFFITSPWKVTGSFIWTNLNLIHPRMLCTKFSWNWPSGSGGIFFFYFVNEFPIFHYYFPLENGQVLHLKKLESCWPKHALCQVWLKLAPWFWRKRFLKISLKYSHYFIIISPLKRWGHSFNETWIPFTQECFVL